jgi:hypothetical protein
MSFAACMTPGGFIGALQNDIDAQSRRPREHVHVDRLDAALPVDDARFFAV